jgi:hypothetical protein
VLGIQKPAANDNELAEDEQDGERSEFNEADSKWYPQVTMFFELGYTLEVVPPRLAKTL